MATDPSCTRPKRSSSLTHDVPNKKRLSGIDDDDYDDAENADSSEDAGDDDAITQEEIDGTDPPAAPASPPSSTKPPKPRNAFSELMAPKPKPKPKAPPPPPSNPFAGRNGLGIYLADPASHPSSRVIFHTAATVAIRDLFPKSTVHTLLLPRSPAHTALHPFDALADPSLLAAVRADAARLKALVAAELERLLGPSSASSARRNAVLNGSVEPDVDAAGAPLLPPAGRDWAAEVVVGVHARPSMNHLHVHVMSRDMHSERLRHKKHYLSFTTEFFVPLEDFPLGEDDGRRRQGKWPDRPMVCWRCGKDFGNRFKDLKQHLDVEFEKWKRE